RADEGQVELIGVDLPLQGHVFGVAGASSRDDGDIVERIDATTALAFADLDFRTHPNSLSHHRSPLVSAHYEERLVSPGRRAGLPWQKTAVTRPRRGRGSRRRPPRRRWRRPAHAAGGRLAHARA